MRRRRAARLAWSLFGVTVALLVPMTLLSIGREPLFDTLLFGLLRTSLATVGALVASRHPGNAIGWLFCGLALYGSLAENAQGWGYFAAERGLPAGELGEWIIQWSWIGELTVWTIVFLLFPDGHLPSRRWRFVPWIAVAGCTLALTGQALSPDLGAEFTGGVNPFAVEGIPTDLLYGAGVALLLVALLAAIVSLIVRFRRAGNVERQQMKWFAFAASGMGIVMPLAIALYYESILVQIAFALAVNVLPIAIGIAILRHRLYDIDVIVNRTLVYGALTISLALIYFGSVVGLQRLFSPIVGEDNQFAVVASTLLIAALFQPLRRSVQGFIDRRFYRKKYDARKTLEEFGARLRDETDLETLSDDLAAVARNSLQPAHVSLWLRAPDAGSRSTVEQRKAAL